MKTFTVRQKSLGHRAMNALVDFNSHRGLELYHTYKGLALFDTRETDVAAGVGIMALNDVAKAGIPSGVVAPLLGEVVYAAITLLAMQVELWQLKGPDEEVAQFRGWITDGSVEVRKRRIQDMFGISERRSSQYLLVSGDYTACTTDDIAHAFEPANQALTTVLNALAYGNKMKSQFSGALFIFKAGGEE